MARKGIFLFFLDAGAYRYGILAGIGSACSSHKGTARIPKELGLKDGYEMGMLRLSINAFDEYDWDKLTKALRETYAVLSKYLRN